MEPSSQVRSLRVGLQDGVDVETVADAIEATLEANEIATRNVYTKNTNSASITAHTYMLIAMLLLIVVSIAKIAVAGLASCMSTAVIERTREFGVMRTLGARAYDIQNSIIVEAILIGICSWIVAVLVAVPLTVWIGVLMSEAVDRTMPIVFSPLVAGLWLLGVALVAIIASVAPARRAARLTVRQTLDHT
jgi:putative ABC transport system permease protein